MMKKRTLRKRFKQLFKMEGHLREAEPEISLEKQSLVETPSRFTHQEEVKRRLITSNLTKSLKWGQWGLVRISQFTRRMMSALNQTKELQQNSWMLRSKLLKAHPLTLESHQILEHVLLKNRTLLIQDLARAWWTHLKWDILHLSLSEILLRGRLWKGARLEVSRMLSKMLKLLQSNQLYSSWLLNKIIVCSQVKITKRWLNRENGWVRPLPIVKRHYLQLNETSEI